MRQPPPPYADDQSWWPALDVGEFALAWERVADDPVRDRPSVATGQTSPVTVEVDPALLDLDEKVTGPQTALAGGCSWSQSSQWSWSS
ncbi:hypothetical protein [Streptomyces sp. NBC_00467]|uniref:hypothetical protein n=1 Tax=Streptomyces sp. NBC_00467 TaxID=2975752 RepID=UPI002E17220C